MSDKQPIRVGIDVGGTYTDLVMLDTASHQMTALKVPSTPHDLAEGVLAGLDGLGVDLAAVRFIVHGSTVGVNTVIQKNGAKTGLLTTAGFEDVLEIGTMSKPEMYNLFYRKPRPLVSREHRIGINERMTFAGEVLASVDEDEVKSKVQRLVDAGITSVAVATLHSYANPQNEDRIAKVIADAFPTLSVSISHKVVNQRREFERMSTAVINAYIAPAVQQYLDHLETNLRALGFTGVIFIMKSNGGVMIAEEARAVPVHTLLSGPVAGSIAGKILGDSAATSNVITFDMGGTSCDISVILQGESGMAYEAEVEGYPVMTPLVDISYLGAGGGSIASIVGERSLRVGPESAGADPGPACYAKGGTNATVTDANLVLGRLGADERLAGDIPLQYDLAAEAVRRNVAEPLGLSLTDAALGIVEIACVKMAYAIRAVTIEQGLDPRDFVLISFGGAGSMHTPFIAAMVGIRRVLIPWSPGTVCAWGMLNTDLRHDSAKTIDYSGRQLDPTQLSAEFQDLEIMGGESLARQGVERDRLSLRRAIDMRYRGQEHTITIPLGDGPVTSDSLKAARDLFDQTHERKFAHSSPSEPVEAVNIRVEAIGTLDKPGIFAGSPNGELKGPDATLVTRDVVFREGTLATPIHMRERLRPGTSLTGPAIIMESGSTTVLPPGFALHVDALRNLIVDIPESSMQLG